MDRAAIVVCPIIVVGVVMLCGTAQPSIQRSARFMLVPLGKLIVSADVAFGQNRRSRSYPAMSALPRLCCKSRFALMIKKFCGSRGGGCGSTEVDVANGPPQRALATARSTGERFRNWDWRVEGPPMAGNLFVLSNNYDAAPTNNPTKCRGRLRRPANMSGAFTQQEIRRSDSRDVRLPNRPFWVKRFQTIHHHSFDVARGLV